MSVRIEWVCEELEPFDNDGEPDFDIVNVNHADTFAEGQRWLKDVEHSRIGLVRDRYVEDRLVCRSWAYVEDGKLPSHFEDAFCRKTVAVPARYVEELGKAS